MVKIPTIKEVAKAAGVSVATVSRVLNQEEKVVPATREHVLRVIKQMGYTPNALGRNLRISATKKILVLLPSMSNQFYSSVIRGIEAQANKQQYQVLTSTTHSDSKHEYGLLQMLFEKSVDGVILLSSELSSEELSRIAESFPLVLCCEYTNGARVPAVTIDNYQAAVDAMEYLVQCGHKRIALVSNEKVYSAQQRTKGYLDVIKKYGLKENSAYLIPTEYTFQAGVSACKRLMRLNIPPTAIFTISDVLAAGVIKQLVADGKKVGQDVDVFGFDNISLAKMLIPRISTVSQPQRAMGEQAMKLLLERIQSGQNTPQLQMLPHQLVIRESTRNRIKKEQVEISE